MTSKRWCVFTTALLLTLLFSAAALVILIDPFEIYHRALFHTPAYDSKTQMYAQAGVAKSYTYDSVIIGSSVTENCAPSVYDGALGGHFVKLSMNAGTARDHAKMMDIAFRTHEVKRVVYGLDLFAYSLYPTNQKAKTPDYLYDDNLLNDVYYLFNRNVLLNEIPRALARLGTTPEDVTRDIMYAWTPDENPGEAALRALVNLSAPPPKQAAQDSRIELTRLNLEQNLLPYIQAHRDTEFLLFFPPYLLLYWADLAAKGELDASLAQKQYIGEALLKEPNVRLYDFQIRMDWVADYDAYYDLIHYPVQYNDAIAACMASGEHLVCDSSAWRAQIETLRAETLALFPSP